MAYSRISLAVLTVLLGSRLTAGATASWIGSTPTEGAFALVQGGRAATILYDDADATVVSLAANDLASDIERVAGIRPAVATNGAPAGEPLVLVGTLGSSPLLDDLVRRGKLDVEDLTGAWESFVIATVANPLPNVASGLVIAGSDRRGTAFGVYELSQAIGVSPWVWWADVVPEKQPRLFVTAGTRRFGPPSVKYRGIFINDEDWGLHPWAAKTFDPELGDIGPKTYRKVFELLLRLKANTVWPAMHEVTRAFNLYQENKQVADDYAIVMASSHAEPMLRNNVTEWTAPAGDFNYATNPEGVHAYWEERVRENGVFENIYTLGMRGIHDSGMVGAMSMADKVAALERIFADQRALLAKYVDPNVEQVPQVFTPYKEVLDIYRAGLKVPDDVTIVWPDDNHGYIRYFPTDEERRRSGGFGVYYHLSYLGSPLAYLWLYTTPPALVWEEMNKAYDLGARTLWIANVGDIKPAEIGMEFFLQTAWEIDRWPREKLPEFLPEWAAREFGSDAAPAIAAVMEEYFTLNFQRRPEHLQWWLPHTRVRSSELTPEEIKERLDAFANLADRAKRIRSRLPDHLHDPYFELVEYPVRGAALANQRYFQAEEYTRLFNADPARARDHGTAARAADQELAEITRAYNEEIAGGKWRHLMAVEPADGMWRSYRLTPPLLPAANMAADVPATAAVNRISHRSHGDKSPRGNAFALGLEAEAFSRKVDRADAGWRTIPGLGRRGDAVAIYPVTAESIENPSESSAPRLEYDFNAPRTGSHTVQLNLIPTHPIVDGRGLRVAISVDDRAPKTVVVNREVGDRVWSMSVLDSTITGSAEIEIADTGSHTLNVWMVDAGVVIDRIVISQGDVPTSYLGPRPE